MKMNKYRLSGLIIFLLTTMILPLTVFARDAVDTTRPTSLTVGCAYDGDPLSGVDFDLYKVADPDASSGTDGKSPPN